ncbi:putative outer membrane protein [Chitinispirillum alkaliphilum]|nr:putative outer membrane protein [Chitinispirillum alkaliphilum]
MAKKIIVYLFIVAISVQARSYLGLNYPLGLPMEGTPGMSRSMGNTGTGIRDISLGLALNPANMAMPNQSSFSTLYSLEMNTFNGNSKERVQSSHPSFISFIMPLGQLGNVGVSVDKRTDGESSHRSVGFFEGTEDTIYTGIVRSGGLTAWQGGWGYQFQNDLSIGVTYERFFYNMKTDRIHGFADGDDNVGRIINRNQISFPANGIRGGILYPINKLSIGVSGEYIFPSEGTIDSELILYDGTTKSERDISVHLPPSASVGLSYRFNRHWLAAADVGVTLWDRYISDIDNTDDLRRAYSFSAGANYTPVRGQITQNYWERIQYRAGLNYSQMPLEGASSRSLSMGLGLPVQESSGILDVVFEMGRRTDDHDERLKDYSESFYRIHLGINGSRKWFEQRRYTY